MPHVNDEVKKRLAVLEEQTKGRGEECYLFARWMVETYNKNPRWDTIHNIRKASRNPYHNDETHVIIQEKMRFTNKLDVEVAADLAFIEFYRLVGAVHEDIKAIENGNALADAKVPEPKLETVKERKKK